MANCLGHRKIAKLAKPFKDQDPARASLRPLKNGAVGDMRGSPLKTQP